MASIPAVVADEILPALVPLSNIRIVTANVIVALVLYYSSLDEVRQSLNRPGRGSCRAAGRDILDGELSFDETLAVWGGNKQTERSLTLTLTLTRQTLSQPCCHPNPVA